MLKALLARFRRPTAALLLEDLRKSRRIVIAVTRHRPWNWRLNPPVKYLVRISAATPVTFADGVLTIDGQRLPQSFAYPGTIHVIEAA